MSFKLYVVISSFKESSEMSTRGTDSVPVVDFSAYSLEKHIPDEKTLQKLVDDIHNAFTTIGFVYLKNTGCPPQVVSSVRFTTVSN